MKPYAFGVDIGGTAIKLGLFRNDGELLEKWSIPTRTGRNDKYVLADVIVSIQAKLEELDIPWSEVEGVVMGIPGPVAEEGTVMRCINIGWDVFDITE